MIPLGLLELWPVHLHLVCGPPRQPRDMHTTDCVRIVVHMNQGAQIVNYYYLLMAPNDLAQITREKKKGRYKVKVEARSYTVLRHGEGWERERGGGMWK